MRATPLVSVIIPAYNAERYIRQTIDSLLAQTHRPLEIVVVDDGSTDGTRAQVLVYGDRVRYRWQPNSGGCSSPRNHGVRVASGELLAFMDADDLPAPDWIGTQVAFMLERPDVALALTNFQNFSEGDGAGTGDHFATCPRLTALLRAASPEEAGLVFASGLSTELLLAEYFGSCAVMVRRDVVDAVGAYDEDLRACEDFAFLYQVASRYPIGVIPRVCWRRRLHAGSMTSNLANIHRYNIVSREKIFRRETVSARREQLKRRLAGYHLDLAYYYTGRDNGQALRHAIRSLRFRRRPSARHFVRILADLVGRDTNGARADRADGRAPS